MKDWNADLVLRVIEYLNVLDSNRFSGTSRRYYYLVHEYRRLRGPQMVSATTSSSSSSSRWNSMEPKSARDMTHEAYQELQSPPNLALCFSTLRSTLANELPKCLPSDTVTLGVVSGSIQSTFPCLDCRSNAGMLLAHLPTDKAHIKPFLWECSDPYPFGTVIRQFMSTSASNDWKVFLVYASGEEASLVEEFVTALQAAFPNATIVGGICSGGYCSEPTSSTNMTFAQFEGLRFADLMQWFQSLGGSAGVPGSPRHDRAELVKWVWDLYQTKPYRLRVLQEGAIFGVALGGTVPVQSVVSRGVQSLTSGTMIPSMQYVIEQASIYYPGDAEYVFATTTTDDDDDGTPQQQPPPYHMVHRIRDTQTNQIYTPQQMRNEFTQPDFIGLQRPDGAGFDLHMPHPISYNLDAFVFLLPSSHETTRKPSLQEVYLDFFDLTGDACLQHMEQTMIQLQNQVKDEQILAAVMISCSARGPGASSLLTRPMADASIFATHFPTVPCLGFYAGGEIGPLALAGQGSCNVFRQGQAAVQGFTAVFALFIVPKFDLSTQVVQQQLDDHPTRVQEFVQARLKQQ